MISLVAVLIATHVYLHDVGACRLVQDLSDIGASLDEIDASKGEDLRAESDLGIGDEILGRIEAGGSYRGPGARIPLVRGSAAIAHLLVQQACTSSRRRLGVVLASFAAHAVVLSVALG